MSESKSSARLNFHVQQGHCRVAERVERLPFEQNHLRDSRMHDKLAGAVRARRNTRQEGVHGRERVLQLGLSRASQRPTPTWLHHSIKVTTSTPS